MTRQSTFKRKVRARMDEDGRELHGRPPAADRGRRDAGTNPTAVEPRVSDDAVRNATGADWAAWFELLDGGGAGELGHTEIARLLIATAASRLVGAERHGRPTSRRAGAGRRASGPTAGR